METPPHMVDQLLDERGLDFSVFQQEYNETGQLSEDAYLALQEAGIEPQMVDTWIAGQEAIADQQIDSIYNMVGGEQRSPNTNKRSTRTPIRRERKKVEHEREHQRF